MRCGGWMVGVIVCGCGLVVMSGCVSLDDYRKLQAANRTVLAEKAHCEQELYDARQVNDSLRGRVERVEGEVSDKDELLANLRSEKDLLDQLRLKTQEELEALANDMQLEDIAITGPKLPALLDNALKRFADENPSIVVYDSTAGTVKWQADLLFAPGSDVVRDSTKEALRHFTEIIKSPTAAGFEAIVVGHTDTQPIKHSREKHPTNWHLSAHRAISVARVLHDFGYSPERTGVMGCGQYRPVADNTTSEGAGKNRRVEIYLIPGGSIVQTADGWQVKGESLAFVRLPD